MKLPDRDGTATYNGIVIPRLGNAIRLRSRSGVIASLLLVTLAVSIAIGWEARRAAAAERSTAEGVLRDYAGFAAAEFARVAGRRIHASAELALGRITCAAERGTLPGALAPVADSKDCDCGAQLAPLRTVFAQNAGTGWKVAGDGLDDGVRAQIEADLRDARSAPIRVRMVWVRDRPAVVAWQVERQTGRLMAGLVADATALGPLLTTAAASPLLPATLIAKEKAAALLSVRVTAGGSEVFANAVPMSDFSRSTALDGGVGDLQATVGLTPEAAGHLIIGGLPRSRLPVVYGLTAVCIVLVTLTGVQLVREASFSRQRTAFIAGVSHELRTPLTQIRMFAETLALGRVRDDAEHRQSVDVIVRESLRLSQLVDKVLAFTATGHRETLERRRVDFSALVHDAADSFAPVAAANDSTIRLVVEPGLHVQGDPAALRQVVINLLDNAVKYGRPGQTVNVSAARSADGILFAVQDEGPGVAEPDRSRIWEPFWRAPGSEQGGSGLGLAIVEQVITLHGGRVAVENAEGGGARFSVLLVPVEGPPAGVELRPANRVA